MDSPTNRFLIQVEFGCCRLDAEEWPFRCFSRFHASYNTSARTRGELRILRGRFSNGGRLQHFHCDARTRTLSASQVPPKAASMRSATA